MNTVNTLMALGLREIWEHPNLVWRLPVGLLVINVTLALLSVVFGLNYLGSADLNLSLQTDVNIADGPAEAVATFFCLAFFLMGQLVVLSYLLGALFQERKDRSILFWKSLPVSDLEVVLSKLLTGVVLIPLVYLLIGFITFLMVALVLWMGLSSFVEELVSGPSLLSAGVLVVGDWLFVTLKQMWWGLPIFLWILLVSSVARSQPLFWALGLPLVGLLIESSLFSQTVVSSWFWAHAQPLPLAADLDHAELLGGPMIGPDSVLSGVAALVLGALTVLGRRYCNEI